MAIYIKGNNVPNATSYTLYRVTGSTYTQVGRPQNTINFNLTELRQSEGLNGEYTFVVQASAPDFETSNYSNRVTVNLTTGDVSGGGGGGGGDTPVIYAFSINPTPSDASVTLVAAGYQQQGNAIYTEANVDVTWVVSKQGYITRSGTHTVTENYTLPVTLVQESGGETKYTITYKYMSGSTSIKTQTTEQVTAGTVMTFSASGAPSVSGYVCTSVSPSGSQTINSDTTVTYYYTVVQPGEVTVVAEAGTPISSGYFGSIPINGFAPTMPVSAMPDEINGLRFYINGVTEGDEKEMTAFVGYYDNTTDTQPTVIKQVTKMVTLPARNKWTTAADFPITLTKNEVLAAIGDKPEAVLALGCYHSDVTEEGKAYTVGFRNCTTDGIAGTETSAYKGGYFYLGKWALNSSKQHIYAAFLTGPVETVTHTITYKYMSNGEEVITPKTEVVFNKEFKKFTNPGLVGWNFVSVTPTQAIVTSDMTVTYELVRPEGNFVIAETGAKQSTGYHSSGIGINGFATSIDKSLLPADGVIKGVRAYLAGQTEGEVINMTGCLGYSTAAPYTGGYTKDSVVWVKTVEQDVTMTAKSKFTQATDFMFDSGISVADFLAEVGDNTVYIGWYPTETAMQESKDHDIGSAYCLSTSASETAMADDKALYHYLKNWSVNSKRQAIYAGILTNYQN